jgi:hypothetical protein
VSTGVDDPAPDVNDPLNDPAAEPVSDPRLSAWKLAVNVRGMSHAMKQKKESGQREEMGGIRLVPSCPSVLLGRGRE